jgi:hypothetical protein
MEQDILVLSVFFSFPVCTWALAVFQIGTSEKANVFGRLKTFASCFLS